MGMKAKVLQKVYRGLIGGTCAVLLVVVFGILWHSFLGHSGGFGFFSFNILGWTVLICAAVFVGCVKGVLVGLVDLFEKSWLTLIFSLVLWGGRPSIEALHAINRPRHGLYLAVGYAVLSILAGILCTIIVVRKTGEAAEP